MKSPFSTSGFLLIMILAIGCSPAYIPNVINTPLLSNEGELQAGIYGGASGYDTQLSYAVTNNIGIMANGSFTNQTSDDTNNQKHHLIEFGPGYYTKMSDVLRFEAFGGYGFGKTNSKKFDESWDLSNSADLSRFFIQQSIGVTTSVFDGSLSTRFAAVSMWQNDQKDTGLFLEPALTAKIGGEYLKLVTQFGLSLPLKAENLDFQYQPFIVSFGLVIKLDTKKN